MNGARSLFVIGLFSLLSGCGSAGTAPANRSPEVFIGGGGACSGGPTSTLAANFNGTALPAGSALWLTSVFKLQGADAATITMNNSSVTVAGVSYTGPDSTVTLSPATQQATVSYTGSFFVNSSTSFSGNTFLDAVEVPLPSGLDGGIKNVSWSAQLYSSVPNVKVQWQWAAAAYTQFGDYSIAGIKPSDDPNVTVYANSDHAGTPENFKSFVIGGGTGGGGSNFTGSYSSTLGVLPSLCRTD
ncbi:MAG TPA: hypothetical protein VGZ02_11870 [Candidatus Baltobacteraceae bacterium]|jgi:hypothetical protein|nr:hypothetical protein [Candidatus Baltobacteraceae bacterium]